MARNDCKKFEYEGISYKHLLAYFRQLDLEKLPDEYVLKRWYIDAKKNSNFNNETIINEISIHCIFQCSTNT